MKDLKCGLKGCIYNKGYCCCAKHISVDNYTECTSYTPNENKQNKMFEAGNEFIPANYSVDTIVTCTAKCVFNKDNKCMANGITVMGQGQNEAQCLTFIKD